MREEERGEERRERRREERFGELIGMPHALDLQQKYVCNATNVIAGAPRKGITRRTTRRTLEAKIVCVILAGSSILGVRAAGAGTRARKRPNARNWRFRLSKRKIFAGLAGRNVTGDVRSVRDVRARNTRTYTASRGDVSTCAREAEHNWTRKRPPTSFDGGAERQQRHQ